MNFSGKIGSLQRYIQAYNKPKIFGVGANKTGTTSLNTAMKELGFTVGYQGKAEGLIHYWAQRDFNPIIKYCHSAQFFQDIPFSLPYTYIALDYAFPNSKFILTVRDDEEQWYNSITNFHAKKWGRENRIPTQEDLQSANYIYKGYPWEANRLIFDTPRSDPYNKELLIQFYKGHNREIIKFFRHRPNDLLVVNVAEEGALKMLCDFLGVSSNHKKFPWNNRTP